MAPNRPVISVGIQPQIALYSVILGSVCAFGWYTEKYRRDEGELDEQIQKMYLRNAQEAQSKTTQMTATIKGQSMDLDGRMDKLVWGGKAQLKNSGIGSTSTTASTSTNGNNNQTPAALGLSDESSNNDSDSSTTASSSSEEKKTRKKRKKKRKKKQQEESTTTTTTTKEKTLEEQQRSLVLRSSIAGVAVGAVAVVAVSALLGGSSGKK
eukprot:CAMPEP_0116135602 /NCGR_PEP_ID=MMETSP0329-20121206/11275_1 /TAXON_ID=697910 /ORGANISM="Pseudo-nitzschia arenysensis, Strain B593" /LENGTH=209 /DNA_ID=CAMNT_0003630407 /DNA_START=69 /DNA_END=698 /DNA_ORIENTATION=+